MQQAIAIYFNAPGRLDAPFDDRLYYESYRDFSDYSAAQGTTIFIVRGNSYIGNMQFSSGWTFVDGELADVAGPIKVDLIYLKDNVIPFAVGPNDFVVNHLDFIEMASDKWKTYELLGKYMPATYQINNDNWQEVAEQIKTDKIVLKPTIGAGGKGIIIVDKLGLDFPALQLNSPYIAQDFIDSSAGIPGICDGYHDLRIIFFNNEPQLSFVRIPRPGSLLSNVSQGASVIVVDVQDVPVHILDNAREIDAHFNQYSSRFYTTDFFLENGKPYLVELNTMPGFPRLDAEGADFIPLFHKHLHKLLSEAVIAKVGGREV